MARVDYYALEQEIQAILQADAALAGVRIVVEDEILFGAETTPWVGIYLDRRDAPADIQRIGGTRTDYRLRFSIWCWEYSLDSVSTAARLRDDLVGKVEVALMGNRTLNDLVATSWLEGGEFMSARTQGSWLMGAEIVLVAEKAASI